MEIAVADEVQTEERKDPTRAGLTKRKWLLRCQAPDGLNFRLIRTQYQEGENAFETPRHHHSFQQIRFAEKGMLNYAPDEYIPEGDIAYFPRGAYYGPQHRDHGIGITVQYGFGTEMLGGTEALEVYRRGVETLRERGRIEGGVFVDIDPDTGAERRRDPYEAFVQDIAGEKFAIPEPGYEAPILMHPRAYTYFQVTPGVEIKHLGGFYDHPGPQGDVRISMVRLSDGGIHPFEADRAQLVWTVEAGLRIAGRTYPEMTSLYSPRGEEVALSAEDGVELFVVEFPRLD